MAKHILYKTFLLPCLLLLYTTQVYGQQTGFVSFFKAVKNQNRVLLSWQITAGNTCNGIQIFRGTDSTLLVQVGEIVGVCGSVDIPVDYTFVDEQPAPNTTNYYRLQFGLQGTSAIVAIDFVVTDDMGIHIRPHPITQNGKLFFEKTTAATHSLTIYNLHGQQVLQQTTTTNVFDIEGFLLPNGVYSYTITANDVVLAKNKLVIQH